jgi:hypothetical protein
LDAVKDGLFAAIYIQAYYLRRVLDKYSNLEEFYKKSYSDSFPLIKELISLVECGLYPVCQWSVDARDNRKAHVYLEKIGDQLNPVKPGKQSKRPYLYETALFILYYVLLDEFKNARNRRGGGSKIMQMKEGIAGLISTKSDWSFEKRANAAAKKVIMKVFKVNKQELDRFVSKKNEALLVSNLRSLKALNPEVIFERLDILLRWLDEWPDSEAP